MSTSDDSSNKRKQPKPSTPQALNPNDPNNYIQSGDELDDILTHAIAQSQKYWNYSTVRSVTYSELADCYTTVMRLAAVVKTLRGPI